MLADPTDSAAVVRALTRPPVELRSIDLARCTAIARRRKLDMISALEAALESPQLPPEARDRMSDHIPAGRLGTAEDVASGVAFLLTPGASYITGEVLNISGGLYM